MITRLLIIINALAFLWEIIAVGPGILSFNGEINSDSLKFAGALTPNSVLQDHEYWRILTGAFLHGNPLHIVVNMFSLWVLGRFIEAAIGPGKMVFIYFFSLIVAGFGVVYFSGVGAGDIPTVGASGAIFGLFGALFAIGFKFGPRGMELVKQNIGILVVNLVFTFAVPGISKAAHVAGLLTGFALTYLIYFPPQAVRSRMLDDA